MKRSSVNIVIALLVVFLCQACGIGYAAEPMSISPAANPVSYNEVQIKLYKDSASALKGDRPKLAKDLRDLSNVVSGKNKMGIRKQVKILQLAAAALEAKRPNLSTRLSRIADKKSEKLPQTT